MRRDERKHWGKIDFVEWLSNPGLRACSAASRGLCMDIRAMASTTAEPGHLIIRGKAPSTREMARMLSVEPKQLTRCLAELEQNGALGRDARGVIYCPMMVQKCAASGGRS